MMSSIPSASTGIRLYPAPSAASSASRTVTSASTVAMSGRGVMTSRATVSPKSMTEWMKVRSSCSITFSSCATSAMAFNSESVMYECRRLSSSPLDPMMRLASPMRTVDSQRMGGKRIRALTIGALSNAARSACWTAQFFGTASNSDEDDHDFEHDAQHHAQPAEEVLGHNADQGGRDQLADEHQQQNRVQEVGRVLHQPGQLAGAALLLVDQGLGLDPGHADEARLGHGQDAGRSQEHRNDDDEDGVLGVEARSRQQGQHVQAPWLTR